MARATALGLLCLLVGGLSTTTKAEEAAIDVPLCQLLSDPGAYNHKLIRVTGRVSRGFEDFGLHDPSCPEDKTLTIIWLEYGGPEPADVVYCCVSDDATSKPNGKDPLRVGGIETSLLRDAMFRKFERLTTRLRRGKTVQATLTGRYFSGEKVELPDGRISWEGFGHLGIASLFVIQQVIAVSR
jgi:hypothetical protein